MTGAAHGRNESRAPWLLAGVLLVGFALANWYLLTMPSDLSPIAPAGPAEGLIVASIGEMADASPASPDPSVYPETLARPLFRPSRRPPEADKTAPRRVASLPDDLQLVGIMKEGTGTDRALIRSGATPNGEWVGVGHMVGGWRVTRIESGSILFEADGRQERISLYPRKAE
jgi:general secretion pathway protein N